MEFARAAKPQAEFAPRADSNPIDLIALFDLDDAAFRERFRHTPLWRPKRRGLLRNAAIVLGNRPTPAAIPALIRGLNDESRSCAARARGRWGAMRCGDARNALEARLQVETDASVRAEIEAALDVAVDSTRCVGRESKA